MVRSNRTLPVLAPKELVARALKKSSGKPTEFPLHPHEVPKDAYALLVFACTVGCPAERVAEDKFRVHSHSEKSKTFSIKKDDDFRRTFKLMVKAFLPSPDQRMDYLKRSEQYAEACLSAVGEHQENDGYLPLLSDILAPLDKGLGSTSSEPPSHAEVTSIPDDEVVPAAENGGRKVKIVKPYEVKDYQTADYGVVHDSSAILEVEYEDAGKAYRCAICTFEGASYRSVTGHMNAHTPEEREEALKDPNRKAIRGYSWEPNPRQSTRIARLANEIAMAMNELGLTTPESIASAIIEARAKNPNRDENDEPISTEMTAEQQIEAIRRVLGADLVVQEERNTQEKLIKGLQNQIDALRGEMREKDQVKADVVKEFDDYRKNVDGVLATLLALQPQG